VVVALSVAGCKDDKATGQGGGRPAAASKDKETLALLLVKKLAFEAYPTWAMKHPESACPASFADLIADVPGIEQKDPWGNEVKTFCGADLPPGAVGFAAQSAGPDGKHDTADDVRSWK